MQIYFRKSFWHKFNLFLYNCINCRLCQRLHFNKPLLRNQRLNNVTTSIAYPYIMLQLFGFNKHSFCFKVFNYLLPGLKYCKPCIFSAVFVYPAIFCHNLNNFKVMPLPYFKIIRVMCRCYFNCSGTKFHFHIFICYNRDLSI